MSLTIGLVAIKDNKLHIEVKYGEVVIHWPLTKMWSKLKLETADSIYAPLNEYLATVPSFKQNAIHQEYVNVFMALTTKGNSAEIVEDLKEACANIYSAIDFDHLRKWALTYGGIAYNSDILETYTGEYPRVKTYLKDEYNELVILSFYFKLLTPIWSMYIFHFKNIDSEYKDLAAFDLLSTSAVHENPAMHRLKEYCTALAFGDGKNKKMTTAIYRNIGSNEMPLYFLSMLVVRRLSIGEIRDPNATLIKVGYKFLESKTKTLTNGIIDKVPDNTDNDETETIAEQYRITQKVPDYAIDIAEAWLETRSNAEFASFITNNPAELEQVQNLLEIAYKCISEGNTFNVHDYHFKLSALICKEIVNPRSLERLSRTAVLKLIAFTAAWLQMHNFSDIMSIFLATSSPSDSSDATRIRTSPLSNENKRLLDLLYPHQHKGCDHPSKNQGIQFIASTYSQLIEFDYFEEVRIPTDLKDQLAKILFIKHDLDAVLAAHEEV